MNKLFSLVLIFSISALLEDKVVSNQQECVQEVNLIIPMNGRRVECNNRVGSGCPRNLLYPTDFLNTNERREMEKYDNNGKRIITYDCGREDPINYFRVRANESGWNCGDMSDSG
jgi:hypothetical protein